MVTLIVPPLPKGFLVRAGAVASDEQIEAYLLYIKDGAILSLHTLVEDGGTRLKLLLYRLRAAGMTTLRIPKVYPSEISAARLAGVFYG